MVLGRRAWTFSGVADEGNHVGTLVSRRQTLYYCNIADRGEVHHDGGT